MSTITSSAQKQNPSDIFRVENRAAFGASRDLSLSTKIAKQFQAYFPNALPKTLNCYRNVQKNSKEPNWVAAPYNLFPTQQENLLSPSFLVIYDNQEMGFYPKEGDLLVQKLDSFAPCSTPVLPKPTSRSYFFRLFAEIKTVKSKSVYTYTQGFFIFSPIKKSCSQSQIPADPFPFLPSLAPPQATKRKTSELEHSEEACSHKPPQPGISQELTELEELLREPFERAGLPIANEYDSSWNSKLIEEDLQKS